jgi:DNA-binding NarL/FixJ family response regulator
MRVVICDDEVLLREGLAQLLDAAGLEVVGLAGDETSLLRAVALDRPDVAIVDIKMPPTHTDEGLRAALKIRRSHPGVGVLVLSHYLDTRYAIRLLEEQTGGLGYLLKERVSHIEVLVDALERLTVNECVVDPTIVARLIGRRRTRAALDQLSEREQEVLAMMAEGCSNTRIAAGLRLSPKTVERHIGHILNKLDLPASEDQHRRVLAVLAWLRAS